jgi:transposase
MTEVSSDTIGCDVGDTWCELYLLRADGSGKRLPRMKTTQDGVDSVFRDRTRAHVVLEVGSHSRWISRTLKDLGHRVTVANPRRLKLISESNTKNDRADAELLARLGRADVKLLAPVEHRGDTTQSDLAVAKVRDGLVRCRSRLVNQARSLVKVTGQRLSKCDAEYFHRNTRSEVPLELKAALDPLYEALESLNAQIAKLDKEVERLATEVRRRRLGHADHRRGAAHRSGVHPDVGRQDQVPQEQGRRAVPGTYPEEEHLGRQRS